MDTKVYNPYPSIRCPSVPGASHSDREEVRWIRPTGPGQWPLGGRCRQAPPMVGQIRLTDGICKEGRRKRNGRLVFRTPAGVVSAGRDLRSGPRVVRIGVYRGRGEMRGRLDLEHSQKMNPKKCKSCSPCSSKRQKNETRWWVTAD